MLVIVVCYFEGIKSRVDGLVQAYKMTAQFTLQETEIEEKLVTEEFIISFDYPLMSKVIRVVKGQNLTITAQHLTGSYELHLAIRQSGYAKIEEIFNNLYGVVLVVRD